LAKKNHKLNIKYQTTKGTIKIPKKPSRYELLTISDILNKTKEKIVFRLVQLIPAIGLEITSELEKVSHKPPHVNFTPKFRPSTSYKLREFSR
jgi:hypothetical protein